MRAGQEGRQTRRSRKDPALAAFGEDRFSRETCLSVCSKPMQAAFFARG